MRLFLLITLLLFNTASAQEPIWREILPIIPRTHFYDISFPDTLHGFIGCEGGVLLKTKDGGLNWERVNTPLTTPIGVNFPDSLYGFISGSFGEGLWRTFNGGKSWTEVTQNIPSTPREKGTSITPLAFKDGTVYAEFWDNLYRSSDYGDNWKLIYHLQDTVWGGVNKIIFADIRSRGNSNKIYLLGYNEKKEKSFTHILDSTGKALKKYDDRPCGIDVLLQDSIIIGRGPSNDPNHIYTVIGTSLDDGKTWKLNRDYPGFDWHSMDICGSIGFGSSALFEIYRTYDQGKTWDIYKDTTYRMWGGKVKCITPAKAFIVGATIFYTADSGRTWQNLTPDERTEYRHLYFENAQQGFIGGSNGILRTTANGGENWENIALHTTQNLNAITFKEKQQGFIVGDSGLVLRSKDSGKSWSKIAFSPDKNLFAIHVFDSTRWIIAGQHLLCSTRDSGVTWTTESLPDTLRSIDFWDNQNGIAVGDGSTRYHTTDGGKSWLPQTHTDLQLRTIHKVLCYAPQKAFAVATTLKRGGVVLHTTDSGNTWEIRYQNIDPETEDNYPIFDIVRTDDGTLYYTAMNGIAYSKDEGFTWQSTRYQGSTWANRLQIMENGSMGYAVGKKGMVVKTILPNDRPDDLVKQEPFCEIYPNPNKGKIILLFSAMNLDETNVQLYDLNGKLVYQTVIHPTEIQNEFSVTIPEAVPGVYQVIVHQGTARKAMKIVIE